MQEPWVSAEQVAAHIQLHEETVRQYARDRRIPALKAGRRWLFRLSHVDAWLLAGRPTQQEQPTLFDQAAPGR